MSLPHLPTSGNFHQDIILHIQEVHQWRVRLMHNLILVWFLSSFQLRGSQYGAYSQQALEQQMKLLTMKKEHLEGLISFARKIKETGINKMDFQVFNTTKMDEYTKKAKEQWGQTAEYKEYYG